MTFCYFGGWRDKGQEWNENFFDCVLVSGVILLTVNGQEENNNLIFQRFHLNIPEIARVKRQWQRINEDTTDIVINAQ